MPPPADHHVSPCRVSRLKSLLSVRRVLCGTFRWPADRLKRRHERRLTPIGRRYGPVDLRDGCVTKLSGAADHASGPGRHNRSNPPRHCRRHRPGQRHSTKPSTGSCGSSTPQGSGRYSAGEAASTMPRWRYGVHTDRFSLKIAPSSSDPGFFVRKEFSCNYCDV